MGVVSAILKFANVDWFMTAWNEHWGEAVAILPLLGIIFFMTRSAMNAKVEE